MMVHSVLPIHIRSIVYYRHIDTHRRPTFLPTRYTSTRPFRLAPLLSSVRYIYIGHIRANFRLSIICARKYPSQGSLYACLVDAQPSPRIINNPRSWCILLSTSASSLPVLTPLSLLTYQCTMFTFKVLLLLGTYISATLAVPSLLVAMRDLPSGTVVCGGNAYDAEQIQQAISIGVRSLNGGGIVPGK